MNKERIAKIKKKRTSFINDFRKFISRGSIVDLAVAVIIGAAFGKIITSLVNDVIMPLISLALGGLSFQDMKWVFKPAEYDALGALTKSESALYYGRFIQSTVDFLIIAFCIFLLIRLLSSAQRKLNLRHAAPPTIQKTEVTLLEIRDLLKGMQNATIDTEKASQD